MPTNEDIIIKQKEYIRDAIKEAKYAEAKRLSRLDAERSSSNRAELEQRFEAERKLDREKILRLNEDCARLESALASGEIDLTTRKLKPPSQLNMNANRFVGLEDETDVIFHKMVCDKFEKHATTFQRKHEPKFDAKKEVKKLNLLTQKRDVLQKMIDIHKTELGAVDRTSRTGRSSCNYNWESRSDVSSRSGASGNSWATFATTSQAIQRPPIRRPTAVPKLAI